MIESLVQIGIVVLAGLFAAASFIECKEAKRVRGERQRVQGVVKKTYPRVY